MVQENPTKQLEEFEKARIEKEMKWFQDEDTIADSDSGDELDSYEVFDMLRHINDPEHPLTLEQLKVIKPEQITISKEFNIISVYFTPTIPNCSMATLIGLMIRVKLHRCLPSRFKIDVNI